MRVFGIVGNCRGKKRLVSQMVGTLNGRGFSVSTLKRVGDEVDLDRPGKGSHAQRLAGAQEVLIANAFRWAIMSEHVQPSEPDIDTLLKRLAPVDLVLIEGFHLSPYPKCEIVLADQDRRPSYPDDPSIMALITDAQPGTTLPCLAPGAIGDIAAFIERNACTVGARMYAFTAMTRADQADGDARAVQEDHASLPSLAY